MGFCSALCSDRLSNETNHNTLMALHPTERSKLITFYIAVNTPEKLDPKDRGVFAKEYSKVRYNSLVAGTLTLMSLMAFAKFRNLSLSRSFIMSTPLALAAHCCVAKTTEERLAFSSPVIRQLTLKYQFGVFDFHASKRDSFLLTIVSRILSENNTLLNTYSI